MRYRRTEYKAIFSGTEIETELSNEVFSNHTVLQYDNGKGHVLFSVRALYPFDLMWWSSTLSMWISTLDKFKAETLDRCAFAQ